MKTQTKVNQNEEKPKKKTNGKLNELELQRLLDYYRVKMKSIIRERVDWLKKLEGINLATESFHEREWELHNLTEKIINLQQTLSESNIALNNERKRIITFNNEIENYKSKSNFFNLYSYKY